jgi:hypothetical protein
LLCLSLALILLVSCNLPVTSASNKISVEPNMIYVSASQTAEARSSQPDFSTPRPTSTTKNMKLTASELQLLPTITLPITVTRITTLTPNGMVTEVPTKADDRAIFVERIKNIGGSTWTTEYKIAFVDGDLMDGPLTQRLPEKVMPNEEVDISVDLVAPTETGVYRGIWKLQNADGAYFGVGEPGDEAIWVEIVVEGNLATDEGTPTQTANVSVASVTLEVDRDTYIGTCPHTYVFTAQFVLNRSTTLSYNLEGDNDAGMIFKLPPPVTRNLHAGTHTTRFDLTFSRSFRGWLRLHVTAPESVSTKRVNFELTCE